MGLCLCSLLLSNLHVFEITGISDGVSSQLYMSAAIFVVVEAKINSFSFCSGSDIAMRRLTNSLGALNFVLPFFSVSYMFPKGGY